MALNETRKVVGVGMGNHTPTSSRTPHVCSKEEGLILETNNYFMFEFSSDGRLDMCDAVPRTSTYADQGNLL